MADASAKLNVVIALKSVIEDGDRPIEWLRRFAVGLVAAGGAMAAVAGKQAIELGGRITDLATQAQMGAESFQTLAAVGMESGLSMESIATASEKLRRALQEARENGASPLSAALATLQLSAAGLQALAPERQWEQVARAVANATDKQAALNAASEIFGQKNLPKLQELLSRLGAEGFDKLKTAGEKLRIDDADLATLDAAGDKLAAIGHKLKVLAAGWTAEILRAVEKAAAGIPDAHEKPPQDAGARGPSGAFWGLGGIGAVPDLRKIADEAQRARERFAADPRREHALIVAHNAEARRIQARKEAMEEAARLDAQNKQQVTDATREQSLALADAERRERELIDSQQEAAAVVSSIATPLQQYQDELRKLNRLLDENLLTEKEVTLAREAAALKLAAATTLRADENKLNESLLDIGRRRAALDGDYTKTEAEKWSARRDLLTEEIRLRERSLENMRAMRDASTNEEIQSFFDARLRDGTDQLSGLQGQQAQLGPDPNNPFEQMRASLTSLRNEWGTAAQQIGVEITENIGGALDSIGSNVSGLILGTTNWRNAWGSVRDTIATGVINSVVQLGLRWIATQIMMATAGKAIAAASAAATAPVAMAQSAIWAAPATLATIASFGGAAAQAPFSIAGAIGMTQLMSLLPAYARGGEVSGGKQLAWLNEEGTEYVFSAPAVRALGVENLDRAHRAALSPKGGGTSPSEQSGKPARVILVDDRDNDLVGRLEADPRYNNLVQRISKTTRNTMGIS